MPLKSREPEVRPYLHAILLTCAALTVSAESGLDSKAIRTAEDLRDAAVAGSKGYAIVES
ncbi:MAG: hypothetical protein RLZZ537_1292, partial [Pseudomonadota bacterium]